MQMRRAYRKPIIHCTESSFRQPGAVHRGEEVPRRSAYARAPVFVVRSLSHERAMAIAARRRDSNTRCGARVHDEPERLSSARGTMRRGAQTNAAMDWSTIFSSSHFLLPSLLFMPTQEKSLRSGHGGRIQRFRNRNFPRAPDGVTVCCQNPPRNPRGRISKLRGFP